MDKLEAVNVMLRSIQESEVNSLDSGIVDADVAETILDQAKTRILARGWSVNTEENFKITKDISGKINVPSTALRIDPVGNSARLNLVPRNDGGTRRMWDKDNQTFVINQDVYVDIVSDIDFNDLPVDYQWYITACGAEDLQQQTLGSVVLDKFLARMKAEAWANMLDAESDQNDDNVLRDSESVRCAAWRNNQRALR